MEIKLAGINKISENLKVVTYIINGQRRKLFMPIDENVNKQVQKDIERRMKNGLPV